MGKIFGLRPRHGDGFSNMSTWVGVFPANNKTNQTTACAKSQGEKKLGVFEEVKKGNLVKGSPRGEWQEMG